MCLSKRAKTLPKQDHLILVIQFVPTVKDCGSMCKTRVWRPGRPWNKHWVHGSATINSSGLDTTYCGAFRLDRVGPFVPTVFQTFHTRPYGPCFPPPQVVPATNSMLCWVGVQRRRADRERTGSGPGTDRERTGSGRGAGGGASGPWTQTI